VRFDAATAECLVFTYAEGMLSTLAHDLEIRVERFTIDVDDATAAVAAAFDPASLRVAGAMRDGIEAPGIIGARDRRSIESTIARDVLETARFPEIRFRSTRPPAAAAGEAALRIAGTLVLHGREREVTVRAERQGARYVAEARLHQPDFGIRPYSAMLGTLRVAADVLARVDIPLEPRR
jgi:polyisoprenoid-binding protein YceI